MMLYTLSVYVFGRPSIQIPIFPQISSVIEIHLLGPATQATMVFKQGTREGSISLN